jgi:RNA polymerase sigma-70 factor (ECF subfamily)
MNVTDIEALRAFYVGNRQQLFTYALSLTRNREVAEDALQGVFEKLLRGRGLPAELRPYVFRSLRNAALDAWRRAKVQADSIFTEAASPETTGAGERRADDLDGLLQRLPTDERETVVLKIYSGLTFQQIADVRELPLQTVASWYRRGLERLRNMLKEEC